MMRKIFMMCITGITLFTLASCQLEKTSNNANIATAQIPVLPSNWNYVSCPSGLNKFKNCDFELPLPPHAGIDFEQIDSNYFWITGDDVPSAHIENFSYYDAYILKKSLADAITSFACQSQNSDRCITFNYLVKNKNVEIARVINQSEVEFWIRTPNMLLRVRNPDLLPSLTAKDLQTLEMIILNIRSKI